MCTHNYSSTFFSLFPTQPKEYEREREREIGITKEYDFTGNPGFPQHNTAAQVKSLDFAPLVIQLQVLSPPILTY